MINKHCCPASIYSLTEGNLLPSTILELFQRAASEHAKMLGCGGDALAEKGLLWVIIQTRYEICKLPKEKESLKVYTWPLPANRLGYERNYLICDKDGEVLIKGNSLWAIIDEKTRKLASVGEIYPEMEFCMDKPFPDRARRLKDFEAQAPISVITPDDSTIDENNHVNNAFYAAFAIEALGGLKGAIKSFQIDYLHEVLCGEELKLFSIEEENKIYVKGESSEGTRMFACAFTLQ